MKDLQRRSVVLRYSRLYLYFIRFAFSTALMFRFEIWFRFLMDIVYYGTSIIFFKVLFLQTATIGGWTQHEAMIFVGTFILLDAVQMTFYANGMWMVIGEVNSGAFDFQLVRPVSPMFMSIFRTLNAGSFMNLLAALGILIWAFVQSPINYSFDELGVYILLLMNGMILFFAVRLLFALLVFWNHSPYGLNQVFFSLVPLMETPDVVFTGLFRWALLTVMPFGIMASLPVRQLIDGASGADILLSYIVTFSFLAIALILWKRSLREYSSASS